MKTLMFLLNSVLGIVVILISGCDSVEPARSTDYITTPKIRMHELYLGLHLGHGETAIKDEDTGRWVKTTEYSCPVKGGRDGGFRIVDFGGEVWDKEHTLVTHLYNDHEGYSLYFCGLGSVVQDINGSTYQMSEAIEGENDLWVKYFVNFAADPQVVQVEKKKGVGIILHRE